MKNKLNQFSLTNNVSAKLVTLIEFLVEAWLLQLDTLNIFTLYIGF